MGLLKEEFAEWELDSLSERRRKELAGHFVQRRRADVLRWLDEDTPFPERESSEIAYTLTPEYRRLFDEVYDFARELVRSSEILTGFRRRVRYWTALALLRCIMSSPASAETALEGRAARLDGDESAETDDAVFAPYVYDALEQEGAVDVSPSVVVEEGERDLDSREQKRLRGFARQAAKLRGLADAKLLAVVVEVKELLAAGFSPIVYCRYIATADYVAQQLKTQLNTIWSELHIISITGALSEDERQIRVAELSQSPHRVLVATDCLSEGINLQGAFNAVIHYDLPWNPNRLEQREGRVDRYGQVFPQVKTVLVYGQDNPIDGAVLDVLIRKAVDIRRTLGVTVPLPVDSNSVVEAVLRSLLLKEGDEPRQLSFFDRLGSGLVDIHQKWDEAVAREKISRTRFAQHAINPAEVARELEESDAVLGNPQAVEQFTRTACRRLGIPLLRKNDHWLLDVRQSPEILQQCFEQVTSAPLSISFYSPAPPQTIHIGRNHPFTESLAEYLLDTAITPLNDGTPLAAARSAVIPSDMVARRTTLLVLRLRFLLTEVKTIPSLAESCLVCAFTGRPGNLTWLNEAESLHLLHETMPVDNVSPAERGERLTETLSWLPALSTDFASLMAIQAERLHDAHQRVRQITRTGRLTVSPQGEPVVLGVYVLQPVPGKQG